MDHNRFCFKREKSHWNPLAATRTLRRNSCPCRGRWQSAAKSPLPTCDMHRQSTTQACAYRVRNFTTARYGVTGATFLSQTRAHATRHDSRDGQKRDGFTAVEQALCAATVRLLRRHPCTVNQWVFAEGCGRIAAATVLGTHCLRTTLQQMVRMDT
jgi:hypothetical protein